MERAGLIELNAVAAVATHRSFRVAAAELAMSPSALSHAVAALEQKLGVRLFNRTTRSVALSPAGEQFLARVQPALREITDAMNAASEQREVPAGMIRLNTSAGAAPVLLPAIVETVRRYSEIAFDLVTDDGLVDIVADGFDAGVRSIDQVPKDMIAVPFGPNVEFAVVGAPRYLKRHAPPVVPADLKVHACIRRRWPSGAIYRWEFEKRRKEIAIDVTGPLTFDVDALMISAALDGIGLAYVSLWSTSNELARGRLVRVLADWTPAYPGLHLYYPGRRHMRPSLRAFVDVLRAVVPAGKSI